MGRESIRRGLCEVSNTSQRKTEFPPDVRILVRMKLLAQSPICFFDILFRSSLV